MKFDTKRYIIAGVFAIAVIGTFFTGDAEVAPGGIICIFLTFVDWGKLFKRKPKEKPATVEEEPAAKEADPEIDRIISSVSQKTDMSADEFESLVTDTLAYCEYENIAAIAKLRELTGLELGEAKRSIDAVALKYAAEIDQAKRTLANQKRNQQLASAPQQASNVARCPKCGSTSLSGHKKGFGIGKAVVGAAATGGLGLMAGNIGAKKVRVTCLNCGKQFWAGHGR